MAKLKIIFNYYKEGVRVYNYDDGHDRTIGIIEDGKVEAIKAIRAITGWGLRETKEFVETLRSNQTYEVRIDDKDEYNHNPEKGLEVLKTHGFDCTRSDADIEELLKKAAILSLEDDNVPLAKGILNLIN